MGPVCLFRCAYADIRGRLLVGRIGQDRGQRPVARERVNFLAELRGFKLPGEILLLVASVSIQPGRITAKIPEEHHHSAIKDLEEVLAPGRLTPGKAAMLRGELGFPQSLMFGKFGRSQLQPCSNRKNSRALGGNRPANAELRAVIPWMGARFGGEWM